MKKFERPEVEIEMLMVADVITASSCEDDVLCDPVCANETPDW